ncbi:MAG: hypothetical protein PVJ03_03535 [Chromatiaceae bacterium]|jgi:hypothetical protein
MGKKKLLKIVNPILLLLVMNQLATGFRPRLYGPGSFRLMHKQMALLLSLALMVHLVLNFSWVRNTYWKRKD